MKNKIKATAKEFTEKFTENNNEESKNPQHEVQKQMKEREKHPSVKDGVGNIIFQIMKDLPNLSSNPNEPGTGKYSKRALELKNIRIQKSLKEKHKQLSR